MSDRMGEHMIKKGDSVALNMLSSYYRHYKGEEFEVSGVDGHMVNMISYSNGKSSICVPLEDVRLLTYEMTCGVFLIDKFDRMLILHPTNHDPRHWSIPKGLVNDKYELHQVAMERELEEETGIILRNYNHSLEYLGLIRYKSKNKYLSGYVVKVHHHIPTRTIRCDSMFHHGESDTMMPECDRFQWVDIGIAEQVIQEEQQEMWETHKENKS
jgi:predicted NUDIX family NTP pyrophosphohydrolase